MLPLNDKLPILDYQFSILLVVLATFVLLLTGCRMNEAVYHPDGTRIIYARPPLMTVVEELDERHLAVRTVVAKLNVTLHDRDKNKDYELAGVYLGDKEGNMRLRITATTGQLVLDFSEHNGTVQVDLPRKGRYFRGKPQDLLNNSQSQLSLLAHIGHARDLFFPRAWTPAAVERRVTYEHGREIISVLEKPGFTRKRSRRLTMAPESAVVEKVEVYDRTGKEVGTVGYSNWQYPAGAKDANQSGPLGMVYPVHISLVTSDSNVNLEMEVEQFDLNCYIPDEKFEVPPPEDTRTRDLGSALKHGGNLWD